MKVGHIKLPLGHLTFASWQAPGFPCSEVIPSLGYSKEWRRWCSSFIRAVNLLDFLLFTVKYRWIASRHIHRHWWIKKFPSALLQLKIHYWSFTLSFWLKATWMLKFYIDPGSRAVCLPTITKAAGSPGAPVLIPYVFFLQVCISFLNYIRTPLPTYIWPMAMLIALQPHLLHILLSHLLSPWVKATISTRAPMQSCTV